MTEDSAPATQVGVSWLGRGFQAGQMVGAFELDRILGRGGMGEVWIANRAGADFTQRVAVKLLPGGNASTIARFRRERRILAKLDHPHIAKLIDGGVSEGHPWLAMELVEGVPLTAWAQGKRLAAKLALFAQICDAVQLAHRNLVVHRDLKPGNILVTEAGVPKLLDFGIAKLLAPDDTDRDDLTRTYGQPMTPEYASPEQLRGEDVTIASDIWALGIVLFELLTGARPYATMQDALDAVPRRAHVDKDLDAICLKALRANPADRYPSVEAFARDIRAHLAHTPVAARGDATSYLVRTMLRRHRAGVAVIGLALAIIIAGVTGTMWQARRAEAQARKATRAFDLVVGMIEEFDPEQATDKPFTQREILLRGEQRMNEIDDDPDVQARLLETIAQIWFRSDESLHALPIAVRAMLLERMIDPHSMRFEALLDLAGNIELDLNAPASAQPLFEEARVIAAAHHDDRALAIASNDLAAAYQGEEQFAAAGELRVKALDLARRVFGVRAPETIAIDNDLAVLRSDEGNYKEARVLQAKACDEMRDALGPTHPQTLTCRGNLALVDLLLADPKTALVEIDAVLADEDKIFGEHWHDRTRELGLKMNALQQLGRTDEALAISKAALASAHPEDRAGLSMQRAFMALGEAHSIDAIDAAFDAWNCSPGQPCSQYAIKIAGRSRRDGLAILQPKTRGGR
ncbi:MAG: serine/threonine-protein kinase [Kofleriaceae bacterium]